MRSIVEGLLWGEGAAAALAKAGGGVEAPAWSGCIWHLGPILPPSRQAPPNPPDQLPRRDRLRVLRRARRAGEVLSRPGRRPPLVAEDRGRADDLRIARSAIRLGRDPFREERLWHHGLPDPGAQRQDHP